MFSVTLIEVVIMQFLCHFPKTFIMQDGLTAFDKASIEGHIDVCQELWIQQSLLTSVYDDVASDSVL